LKFTESVISQALEFAYEKSIGGFAGVDSAAELAASCKKAHPGDKRKQVDSLIKRHVAMGAASGFLTGLGGLVTLPVTVPANIASVLFLQVRMIIAVAIIGGYDPKDSRVKTFVYSCLLGNAVKDALKDAGVEVGKRIVLRKIIFAISSGAIIRINRMVGFRLLAKFGEKGLVNLGKLVPVMGGVLGGAMDAVWVAGVGKIAKSIFVEDGVAVGEAESEIKDVKVEVVD